MKNMSGTAQEFRKLMVPPRDECGDLLDVIVDALGYMEPGRGDREYREAMEATRTLRAILAVNDV